MGVAGDSQVELFWNLKSILKILKAIHRYYIEYLLNWTKFFYVWFFLIFFIAIPTDVVSIKLRDKILSLPYLKDFWLHSQPYLNNSIVYIIKSYIFFSNFCSFSKTTCLISKNPKTQIFYNVKIFIRYFGHVSCKRCFSVICLRRICWCKGWSKWIR